MKNSAFDRGVRAAGYYNFFSKTAKIANAKCINWASKHKLPRIVGRLPVPLACISMLTFAALCGAVAGGIILLVATAGYMLANLSLKETSNLSSHESGPEYRCGRDGYRYYHGSDDSIYESYGSNADDED